MDNTFILNPKLGKLDIIDALDERLNHIKVILSYFLATEDGSFDFCDSDNIYALAGILYKLIEETEVLQIKLVTSS